MKLEELEWGNHWFSITYPFKISNDLAANIESTRQNFRKHIGSVTLFASYGLFSFINSLPYDIPTRILTQISKKITMGMSSIPDLGDGFDFNGMKSKGFFAVGPAMLESLTMFYFFNCN